MNRVFSRPLFKGNFVQRYAQGGIVSTVMGPEEQDPMAILTGMAEQVDATEQNLDAANNIDEILTSFAGTPKTAQDARAELAELVGPRDAEATPESVLALVQPTMAIMEMSRQMSPPGGIASMPMEEAAPMEGAAPTNFTPAPDGSPVPGFAVGGPVDYNQIMQDYAGMQQAIPRQYGADPASAWLALAQLGAGLAQGKTFSQGLSMGTQLAAPVMQQGIQNVRDEKSRLSAFVAAEATRQKEAAARAAEIADQRAYEAGANKDQRAFEERMIRLKDQLEGDPTGESERLFNRYMSLNTQLMELPEDDPLRPKLELERDGLKGLLFNTDSENTPDKIQIAREVAKGEGLVPGTAAYDKRVSEVLTKTEVSGEGSFKDRAIQTLLKNSGFAPGSPEYIEMENKLNEEALKSGGTSVINNLGDKAGAGIIDKQFASEQKYLESLRLESQAARTTKQALAPVLTMLEPVRRGEQPSYITGAGGDSWRLLGSQALTTLNEAAGLGLTNDQISAAFAGDPAAGEVLRASMARLRTGMSEALSRVTNLQLEVLRDQLPNLSMTPRGNLFVADMLNRTADRTLKVEQYAQQLERTYAGTINPANKPAEYRDELYKAAGVTAFNGYETGKPFDENGKPIMSLNEYISHLDKTEPLLTKDEIAELQRFERGDGTLFNEMASGKEVRGDGTQPWETDPNNIPGTRFVFGGREWIRTKNGKVPAPGRN